MVVLQMPAGADQLPVAVVGAPVSLTRVPKLPLVPGALFQFWAGTAPADSDAPMAVGFPLALPPTKSMLMTPPGWGVWVKVGVMLGVHPEQALRVMVWLRRL